MAVDLKVDMNAMGYGPQDMRSEDGGNNSRGMLDQIRPTGIMATGNIGRTAKRMMEVGRKPARRGRK